MCSLRPRLSVVLRGFQSFFVSQPPPKPSRFPASSIQTSCATRSANVTICPATAIHRNPVDCRDKLYTHRSCGSSYHNPTHKQTLPLSLPNTTTNTYYPIQIEINTTKRHTSFPTGANTTPNVSVKPPLQPSPLLQTTCTSPPAPP
jgi:hypothetical protein